MNKESRGLLCVTFWTFMRIENVEFMWCGFRVWSIRFWSSSVEPYKIRLCTKLTDLKNWIVVIQNKGLGEIFVQKESRILGSKNTKNDQNELKWLRIRDL